MQIILPANKPIKGEITVAPDKSISHRTVIFSALANGEGTVNNFLKAADTLSTCNCMRSLGIDIKEWEGRMIIRGQGLYGLREPLDILDCGNSGTTIRLLSGLLSGQPFFSVLSGDNSLNKRPMRRVIEPLKMMGADISARADGNYPPLAIKGSSNLNGLSYSMPVASAQVKTSLLLAGLYAGSTTHLLEPEKSRDHSERMLSAMGAELKVDGSSITLQPGRELEAQQFEVPGDISSAAFFMVTAAIIPGSELLIKDVGINPTRAGVIEVLEDMGADIKIENYRVIGGEPIADIIVIGSSLKAAQVSGEIIPRLIDEIPILAVAMAMAEGISTVKDASELRVKESDRIVAICSELSKMGVNIEETEDGFNIHGNPDGFKAAVVDSRDDHRIAMSLAVAALRGDGETTISNSKVVAISFPDFWPCLARIAKN